MNAFGKSAVLIPYPFAAELHQDDNANYLATLGAAEVISNSALDTASALAILERLCNDDALAEKGRKSILPAAWDGAENLLKLIDENAA